MAACCLLASLPPCSHQLIDSTPHLLTYKHSIMKLSFVICIISAFAIAPTKGETIQHLRLLGDGSCSPEGEKSTDCGAQPRDDRAEMCCPGLKCGGENDKICVEDKDTDDEDKMVGTSYCTFAPDYDCFETGWPACCGTEDCPDERPGCEITPEPTESETPEPTMMETPEPTVGDEPAPTSGAAGVFVTGFATVVVAAPLLLL